MCMINLRKSRYRYQRNFSFIKYILDLKSFISYVDHSFIH